MNELPKLTEEDINEIVYDYYGFTVNEIDHNVGYWCTRFTEERTKRKGLEHNWNELKSWLEENLNELKQNDIYDRTSYEMGQIIATECFIAKIEELEEGGNNDNNTTC